MGTPDKAIPQDLLEKAHCIVIVPGLKKAAFGIGGKYGRGFVMCRIAAGGTIAATASTAAIASRETTPMRSSLQQP